MSPVRLRQLSSVAWAAYADQTWSPETAERVFNLLDPQTRWAFDRIVLRLARNLETHEVQG